MSDERTFIMVKPDGVHRGLVGEIIKRFESKGFKLVGMKFMWVSSVRQKKAFATCLIFFHLICRLPRNFWRNTMLI